MASPWRSTRSRRSSSSAFVCARRPPSAAPSAGIRCSPAGLMFIRSRPAILGAPSLDMFAVLLGGATALLPVYARDILHIGPWGLGLLRNAPAIGALVMALVLARWMVAGKAGTALLAGIGVFGAATVIFGLSTEPLLSFA